MTSAVPVHRVVLIGFMAAGKSTVGRHLAAVLGWSFHDLDEVVEAREGRTIAAIFSESGEAHFRRIETLVAREYLERDGVVLATGGGWAAEPGNLESLPEGTLTVWLKVSVEEAVRRADEGENRPLLVGRERLASAVELLRQRMSSYAAADVEVDTEGRSAEDVSAQIAARVRRLTTNPTK